MKDNMCTPEEILAYVREKRPDVDFGIGVAGWANRVVSIRGDGLPRPGISTNGECYIVYKRDVRSENYETALEYSAGERERAFSTFLSEVEKVYPKKKEDDMSVKVRDLRGEKKEPELTFADLWVGDAFTWTSGSPFINIKTQQGFVCISSAIDRGEEWNTHTSDSDEKKRVKRVNVNIDIVD